MGFWGNLEDWVKIGQRLGEDWVTNGVDMVIHRGIAKGSSLSPLLGAFYLLELDQRIEKLDVKYFRYMDDILILAPTRWKLKKAIRIMNQTFNDLSLEQHPDKTIIGRTERGFDFLGYYFELKGICLAEKTVFKCITKALRLYEQEPHATKERRLGEYIIRWEGWVYGGKALHKKHIKAEINFYPSGLLDLFYIV